MADQFDLAQELDARYRAQAIEDQARRSLKDGPSRKICLECGESIPQKRREASPGCTHCISCASLIEKGYL